MAALSRRAFFRFSLERLALLASASRVAACSSPVQKTGQLVFLSVREAAVLDALAEVLVPPVPELPIPPSAVNLAERIDRFLAAGDAFAAQQFKYLLRAFEYYPAIATKHFTRFTKLGAAARKGVLHSFVESRLYAKQMIFVAFKSVVCNHYYSAPSVQTAVGYQPACRF